MKVAVISLFNTSLEKQLREEGFKINNINPDIVISIGGEGSFLFSEQHYPNIPKLFIKHRKCKNCQKHNFSNIINKLKKKKYKIKELIKLEASIKDRIIRGINDINIHYTPPCALRFNLNNINNIIGDGVLIATPHGSSAYYKSITGRTFKKGIGIAFNNTVKKIKNPILNENTKIIVKITRGHGTLSADCNKELIPLKENNIIKINKARRKSKVIIINKELRNIIK